MTESSGTRNLAVVPSFEEYRHAREVLDHHDDYDYADVRAAVQWAAEFEGTPMNAALIHALRLLPLAVHDVFEREREAER